MHTRSHILSFQWNKGIMCSMLKNQPCLNHIRQASQTFLQVMTTNADGNFSPLIFCSVAEKQILKELKSNIWFETVEKWLIMPKGQENKQLFKFFIIFNVLTSWKKGASQFYCNFLSNRLNLGSTSWVVNIGQGIISCICFSFRKPKWAQSMCKAKKETKISLLM